MSLLLLGGVVERKGSKNNFMLETEELARGLMKCLLGIWICLFAQALPAEAGVPAGTPASAGSSLVSSNDLTQPALIIVVGAAGEEEFGKAFAEWAGLWEQAGLK